MTDYVELRRGMVDSQVRANDVTDLRIVAAMQEIPRERFVPAAMKSLAYIDDDLVVRPASAGQAARYLIEPMVLAKLIHLAEVHADALVLDVGAGTGYSTAILARLSQQVVAVEDDAELVGTANAVLGDLAIANAAVMQGSLTAGWAPEAPYDVILLNGSVDEVPAALFAQLKDGGRLVAVVGRGGAGRATVYTKVGQAVSERVVFNASLPPLPGFEAAPRFTF
ncbi:protein-L-isoaspartate O-methyltransferase [Azorhizobium oxalatiphilum]|uniref:Protein-L-isoaspartate O-methyltransferase n=1 Tax=Azorhizobium oxalatiphilum TaxID=980631 RepID=A0A917BV89_9HYPH|nr:protein-L-isoaspartate O-methyltransferase [Azorhizobium oxalatiphilum]GGF55668.1 protein-L-isoaspartate O-methyltransferase [Azorhizobium oxalatiphilum]